MNDTTPYSIPKEPGRWRAVTLAALVHALLFGFFWVGIRWQNEQPAVVEAEVWDPQSRQAAPRPLPEPEPEPEPEREIRPEPKPAVKQSPPPKPAEETPAARKPDIALEQEKKRKELEKKKLAEEAARQKQLAEQRAEQQAEQRRLEKEKTEKAERAEMEKKKLAAAEQQKKAELDKKRKEEADKKRRQDETEKKMLADIREQELARISRNVSGTGGTGDAPRSQGNNRGDPGYAQRVGAKIKANTPFVDLDAGSGNNPVEYIVELLPDGSLRGSPRKTKSSGILRFDDAVQRAITASQPYPPDNTGKVPSSFIVSHKPKDQ